MQISQYIEALFFRVLQILLASYQLIFCRKLWKR